MNDERTCARRRENRQVNLRQVGLDETLDKGSINCHKKDELLVFLLKLLVSMEKVWTWIIEAGIAALVVTHALSIRVPSSSAMIWTDMIADRASLEILETTSPLPDPMETV